MLGERVERTFVIDVRRRKKPSVYVRRLLGFWLVWTVVTSCVTWTFITEFSWLMALWLFFGYTGILLIPLPFLYVKGREILTARRNGLGVEYVGFLSRKFFIPKDQLGLVSLEQYAIATPSVSEVPHEADWTLNLIYNYKSKGGTKRLILAALGNVEEKEEIYNRLVPFLKDNGFIFEQRNSYGSLPPSTHGRS
jgi:hypothetical protein